MTDKEFEKIYNEAYRAVYWTAMSLLKNEADAEDIVQDTILTLIESYDSIKDKNKVTPWLKKIAANKCLDRIKLAKTDTVDDEFFDNVEAVPEDFLPDTIIESAEMRKIIMDIIENSLSDDIRRTLILFYFDEMSTKEIADTLGIPEGSVRRRLNFARNKIKKEVEKYEEDNDTKLFGMAALPFLSKLFMKEAEQVPFKAMPASLTSSLSASKGASIKEAGTKTAASAARKGTGFVMKKVIIISIAAIAAVGFTVGVIVSEWSKKADKEAGKTTVNEVVDDSGNHKDRDKDKKHKKDKKDSVQTTNDGYFIIEDRKDGPTLTGLTEEGKKQETLVIPAGYLISCTLKEGIVKHVSFESDDDIDLNYLFSCAETTETIELPANLTELPPIDDCQKLKEITIPKGVKEIPSMTFFNDLSLVTINIEGDLIKIGDQAFNQCRSLENINLPDSINEIGTFAFNKCESLKTITLPKGLKKIGRDAFQQHKGGIQTIIVPKEMELESWDRFCFVQYNAQYTVKVVKGSWADIHFDEVFSGNAVKE